VIQLAGFIFVISFYSLLSEVRLIHNWPFFSDEAWFPLQGYMNMQSNRYWSSQNQHLTHDVMLNPVKVGV
jgi:hypothetical protein